MDVDADEYSNLDADIHFYSVAYMDINADANMYADADVDANTNCNSDTQANYYAIPLSDLCSMPNLFTCDDTFFAIADANAVSITPGIAMNY